MIVLLSRLAILAIIIYIIYRIVKYIVDPKRKLEHAHEQKQFYFYDHPENVRKNFLVTYQGVLFEGEKYLGTTDSAFDVVSIFVFPRNANSLQGLSYDDFMHLEKEMNLRYPNAKIDWKSPIKEFLIKKRHD